MPTRTLKRAGLLPLLLAAALAAAGDFQWRFIGEPNAAHTRNPETALFDGKLNFDADSVLWSGDHAPYGCGLVLEFDRAWEIAGVTAVTAKPNQLPYAQTRTEFSFRDAEGRWSEPESVPDVTGRAQDPEFTQASIRTDWQPGGVRADAVKIVFYGAGVWLTEIQVRVRDGGAERLLQPGAMIAGERRSPCDFGAGAAVNIDFWMTDQGYIGNPNQLNRRDRTLFRFDIADCLNAGEVAAASLSVGLSVFGQIDANTLVLEAFDGELPHIAKIDLLSEMVTPVAEFGISAADPSPRFEADVTAAVNRALEEGQSSIAFRLRNATVDAVGNRHSAAEGAVTKPSQITLEIVK